ncbi:hypothetical protein HHL24_02155 [Paraburkholderia sp. RP-4-7]|uniref:Lipoprotein n=1 Tax=Paraburkholderia polaris TaxID=2728848 RepID=A0A848I5K5_9BURK|nr:hypothetical protein [Paraburkholderia polaris]NML96769.1 hypothetical protein [Paraburkholderia polaris]
MIWKLATSAVCLMPLAGCAPSSHPASQMAFAPIKRNAGKGRKCTPEHRLGNINRPARGLIEGNGSFLTPSWQLYVTDPDTEKLSKIESVWNFEGGKMIAKSNKTRTTYLDSRAAYAVVKLANPVWANPIDTSSHPMTDAAWSIDLVDGAEERCESGSGRQQKTVAFR